MGLDQRAAPRALDIELFAVQESLDQLSQALHPCAAESGGFATLLDSIPKSRRGALLAYLEDARSALRLPILPFYREAFLTPIEAVDTVCASLLADGSREAVNALQRLEEETDEPAVILALGHALIRLRTRLIASRSQGPRAMGGEALLSAPDPSGRYALLVRREHSDRIDLLLSLEVDHRGQLAHARAVASLASERRRHMGRFARKHDGAALGISLDEACALAARIGLEPGHRPDDAAMAMLLLRRASTLQPIADAPPSPQLPGSHHELAAVLEQHSLHRWTLDEQSAPDDGLAHALGLLADWLRRKGDASAAQTAHAASAEVREHGARSEVRKMLIARQVYEAVVLPGETLASEARNQQRRRRLRARYFAEITQPRGRDLALLDLSIEAWQALDLAAPTPTGDHAAWAYAIAQAFMQALAQSGYDGQPRQGALTALRLPKVAMDGLDEQRRAFLHRSLTEQLKRFVSRVCSSCPMACFSSLDESAGAVFFAQRHPSTLYLANGPEERMTTRS